MVYQKRTEFRARIGYQTEREQAVTTPECLYCYDTKTLVAASYCSTSTMRLSRREMLCAVTGTTTTLLPGCSSGRSRREPFGVSDREVDPTDEPTSTTSYPPIENGQAGPVTDCPGELTTFDPRWVVQSTGPLAGFELRVEPKEVTVGDSVRVELTNLTNSEKQTGIKEKFDVQYRENRWHTVFCLDDPRRVGLAVNHGPGEGFVWEFEVTEDGLSNIVDRDGYVRRGDVKDGRYRFVYWGISTDREEAENYETNYGIATEFVVHRKG